MFKELNKISLYINNISMLLIVVKSLWSYKLPKREGYGKYTVLLITHSKTRAIKDNIQLTIILKLLMVVSSLIL